MCLLSFSLSLFALKLIPPFQRLLACDGADPNHKTFGVRLLSMAVIEAFPSGVNLLLAAGADPSQVDYRGILFALKLLFALLN